MTAFGDMDTAARRVEGGWLALVWQDWAKAFVPLIGRDGREILFADARAAEQAALAAMARRVG